MAKPKRSLNQLVVYNGHMKKHSLKHQAFITSIGLFQHVFGPNEGLCHDWTLYVKHELDDILRAIFEVDGVRHCIYGNLEYNGRWFLDVPVQRATLSPVEAANEITMSFVRISVEWLFEGIKMHFLSVDFEKKMKDFKSPIRMFYIASLHLCKFCNCYYWNQISS